MHTMKIKLFSKKKKGDEPQIIDLDLRMKQTHMFCFIVLNIIVTGVGSGRRSGWKLVLFHFPFCFFNEKTDG